ncbi:tetratricopeptide repeat protein [Campylobacter geochelonis]|uniref:tetratricopeptide repeat protein n=1 Tax=Campylobacter geochelonis TaxID=1780362 RepID=UPI000770B4BD|nr:SEL1-like repeat protein [Campylobacter geochelonis]CZE47837.1 Sel1 repeat-containing protein [Campylobacter geochelonis]
MKFDKILLFTALICLVIYGFLSFKGYEIQAEKKPKIDFTKDTNFDALSKIKSKCESSDMVYCEELGNFYVYQKKYGLAFKYYEKICAYNPILDNCFKAGNIAQKYLEDNVTAVLLYQKSCESSGIKTCDSLGQIYKNGLGEISKNEDLAIEYLSRSCNKFYYASCVALGEIYESRNDKAKALINYEKSCKYAKLGCDKMKNLHALVFNLTTNPTSELEEFLKTNSVLCDEKNGIACARLAKHFKYLDKEKSKNFTTKACNYGNLSSCPKKMPDESKITNLRKDCASSNYKACSKLAYELNKQNKDGKFDYEIEDSYKKGCEFGKNKISCSNLGQFLSEKNRLDESIIYLKKSCEMGFARGCYNAGMVYAFDYEPPYGKEATKYFIKSCEMGHSWGCYKAGSMYKNAWGGNEKNIEKAYEFWQKSCLKEGIGCRELEDIKIGVE